MSYSKPMVTIELDEYNNLKATQKSFKSLKTHDYQQGLMVIMNVLRERGFNSSFSTYVNARLEKKGLVMVLQEYSVQDDIFIDIVNLK